MDGMGTGKTLQVLAHIRTQAHRADEKRVFMAPTLVIAPRNSHKDWIKTAKYLGFKIVLYYGTNEGDGVRQKEYRATRTHLDKATDEQRKDGRSFRLMKYEKILTQSYREETCSKIIVISNLNTFNQRFLIEETRHYTKHTGETYINYSSRFEGCFHRIVVDEAHLIQTGNDEADNIFW